jgi:hypothetical protein
MSLALSCVQHGTKQVFEGLITVINAARRKLLRSAPLARRSHVRPPGSASAPRSGVAPPRSCTSKSRYGAARAHDRSQERAHYGCRADWHIVEVIAMSASRTVVSAFLAVAAALAAHAAQGPAFAVAQHDRSGKAVLFQSAYVLKKGDVIRVSASNAQPVMVLQVAMCDPGCTHPRLLSSLPLTPYFAGTSRTSQQFVLPADGRVSFWVQWLDDVPSAPLNTTTGQWSLVYVDPFLRFAQQAPERAARPIAASAVSLQDHSVRARFFHRTFLTVSLADAAH